MCACVCAQQESHDMNIFHIQHFLIVFVFIVVLDGFDNLIGERAKRARHYQGCTNSSLCDIYMYGGTYAILVAHATHT